MKQWIDIELQIRETTLVTLTEMAESYKKQAEMIPACPVPLTSVPDSWVAMQADIHSAIFQLSILDPSGWGEVAPRRKEFIWGRLIGQAAQHRDAGGHYKNLGLFLAALRFYDAAEACDAAASILGYVEPVDESVADDPWASLGKAAGMVATVMMNLSDPGAGTKPGKKSKK